MRVLHRYLGFFLAGIMAMYAVSGILMIFRDTDFLKRDQTVVKEVKPNASAEELGQLLGIRGLEAERETGEQIFFKNGSYDKATGTATYTVKQLPTVLDKITHVHKAKSSDPLFYFNIFFGLSLLFFVLSAFWMFLPGSSIFRKGMYYALGGFLLLLLLLLV